MEHLFNNIPSDDSSAQDPSQDEWLSHTSRAIRRLFFGQPPNLNNGTPYGKGLPALNLLTMAFLDGGAGAVLRLWDTLRNSDAQLTAAVEGRLVRVSDPSQLQCSDFGNAERLVLRYGHTLRYCWPWRCWLIWDGKCWIRDYTGELHRLAKATTQGIYVEAADAGSNQERREKLAKWAIQSEAEKRLQAMINLAQSEPSIPLLPEQLDADPWALNVENGVVDLRTGKLRPHRREDYFSKLAPVIYDEHATCPTWERFLSQIFQGDKELINYVRKLIGHGLSGDTSERIVIICWGTGRNGKSTLIETIADMLGDYALRTPTETFMVKRDGSIPNDVAQLPGRRFVHASESEEGRRLAESFIKDVTGRDTMSARFMRAEWFTFKPVCKLWLRTNHKPEIRGTDNAIWDRVRLIPFEFRVDHEDKELPNKLRAEFPGILQWALSGCLSWQTNGLEPPAKVRDATASYRAEMDVLADFITECCLIKSFASVTSIALFSAYLKWCDANSEKALGRKAFAGRLLERGFQPDKGTHGIRIWRGIGLPAEQVAGGA
jgi:putative DNA primase/helicase